MRLPYHYHSERYPGSMLLTFWGFPLLEVPPILPNLARKAVYPGAEGWQGEPSLGEVSSHSSVPTRRGLWV